MSQPQPSLFDEAVQAARGCAYALVGRREANDHFEFTLRGLAGSFIAFMLAIGLNVALPMLFGPDAAGPNGFQTFLTVGTLYGAQIGASALVLKQLGRLDGLLPYLVADNWATFFLTLVSTLFAIVGLQGELGIIVTGLVVIVLEINIARVIVGLKALQIVMLLIAQLVGVSIGLLIIGALLMPTVVPPPA